MTLGRPLALLLSQKRPTANAAVTVVHTGVPDWPKYTRRAEIVIAAAGVPGILQPEHISPGAVVVGGGVRYEGRKLLPDVDERCEAVAGAITPARRRRRPDHDRDAVPQPRRGRRARSMAAEGGRMSVPEASLPRPDAGVCSLCGTPLGADRERCRMCGMVVGIGPGNRSPFTRRALWATIGGLLAIYVVVLLVVVVLN